MALSQPGDFGPCKPLTVPMKSFCLHTDINVGGGWEDTRIQNIFTRKKFIKSAVSKNDI